MRLGYPKARTNMMYFNLIQHALSEGINLKQKKGA